MKAKASRRFLVKMPLPALLIFSSGSASTHASDSSLFSLCEMAARVFMLQLHQLQPALQSRLAAFVAQRTTLEQGLQAGLAAGQARRRSQVPPGNVAEVLPIVYEDWSVK